MNLFRIRGIQLQLHVTFFLLLAVVAWDGWADGQWTGLLWSVATILAFFTCVVLHELGHSLTAIRFGIGVRRILLMPIGGMAEFDEIPRQPRQEFLMTIAGPAVNFVIAGVLWSIFGWPEQAYPADATGFAHLLLHWNLLMGCFNLLPAFPMDGGRILRSLLATRLPYAIATFWAATVGKILCVVGILAALFVPTWLHPDEGPLYMAAVLFAFIFVAGEIEYRAAKRRELDEAHWKTVLERLQRPAPPPVVLNEPSAIVPREG
jgi:Zn-dependent protease